MLDAKEIDIEIARLEYGESSYPAYQKLANLYTIRNQMTGGAAPVYEASYSAAPAEGVGDYGESDFLRAVAGKDPAAVWAVMDELMDTLKIVNARVYNGVLRKVERL